MTMALSYLFAAVNPKLVLTVTVGDTPVTFTKAEIAQVRLRVDF